MEIPFVCVGNKECERHWYLQAMLNVNSICVCVGNKECERHVCLQAIPNVNAIVKYEFTHAIDHLGGRSITAPARWVNVTAFQVWCAYLITTSQV